MSAGLDVVIPTRGRDHLLKRALLALLQDPAVARVIIVDDAPRRIVQTYKPQISDLSERVEVICAGGVGPAGARQVGAEAATSEIVLFLDDDVIPTPDLATKHARRHEGSTASLLVCGYTPIEPRPGHSLSPEATVYSISYEMRCRKYELSSTDVLTHLWGGNFSLRREEALRVGFLSPEFGEATHEDQDFGLRCLEAGIVAVFDREIRAGHEYERTWGAVARESHNRGYSVVLLHRVHERVLGPYDPRYFETGLAWLPKVVIRVSSYPLVSRSAITLAHGLRALGAWAGSWRLQITMVRLLRRVQGARGANDALQVLAESSARG
jgi:glycosyltransferase involved in cell wall biosynthesis